MSSLFQVHKQEINWGGRTFSLETGKIARQADGAVIAKYGETTVLCTVVGAKKASADASFFPLSVHFQEKTFAVGRIPGGFFKREGKPSEKETLTSRLIDRPIRPLFPEGFYNEVQVICTVLSYDYENDTDITAMIGAAAALSISGIPFAGPIAGARVGYIDGDLVLNPTPKQMATGKLDLVVAGTREGVLMVESEAKELSEEVMLRAIEFGHRSFQPVIEMIEKLKHQSLKTTAWNLPTPVESVSAVKERVAKAAENDLRQAYELAKKQERQDAINQVKLKAQQELNLNAVNEDTIDEKLFESIFEELKSQIVRSNILEHHKRVDGRGLSCVRPIECEVGILPRTHGSALFTRGETQALVVTTLGTAQDEQLIDGLEGDFKERFLLHYNFPPYSVGEAGRFSGPGRREIGHGRLAWRALHPIIPTKEDFSYTTRTVSEITESNGSSSMATVCGASLALMDAGVPLKKPVAGIAMGLIKEGDKFAVLSDILGDEDHLGDMDFKVAGTDEGITALQMDIKITSITPEIMKVALTQANQGRMLILSAMAKALESSRVDVSEFAPKLHSLKINRDKIRELIGPGGKVIREICETSKAKIDIDEDGRVTIAAPDSEAIKKACDLIQQIVGEPEIGVVYRGKVVKVTTFGAFVNFFGGKDGLVHISELTEGRVQNVTDVVNENDVVYVKFVGLDDRGKIKLTMRGIPQTKLEA